MNFFFSIFIYIILFFSVFLFTKIIDTMRNSKIDSLKIKDLIGAIIFLWMSYQQLQTNIILANLRKDKNGIIVTKEHKIPRGGLFNYISAPLQFTEIGMYMALKIIISQGETYFFVCLWVVVNQVRKKEKKN